MTISWPFSRQQVLDASGRPLLVPSAFFFAAGTTQPQTVFSDAALTVPLTQPVTADGTGRFPRVYLPQVLYREEIVGPYGELLWSDDGLGEAPPIATTDPVVVFDPTAMAATGDVKWRLDGSIQPGWVRMNARTIGGAESGATEFADTSARALFIYLWSTFADGIASVIGGRGTSAADDFTAGKQITIPSMQGLVAAGVDDMGSSAANRLQVTAGLTLTAGSVTATVDNPGRIARGMAVIGPGISADTSVVARVGNVITLSKPAAAGSTGTISARFSSLGDAQAAGATGSDCVAALGNDNLPKNLPVGTTSYDPPAVAETTYQSLTPIRFGDGGTVATLQNVWNGTAPISVDPGGPQTLYVTLDNPGGDVPISILQPTRLGTFYLRV